MRYGHDRKPRNPYNMIIQENHAADKAVLIIPHFGVLCTNYEIKEIKYPLHAVNHQA